MGSAHLWVTNVNDIPPNPDQSDKVNSLLPAGESVLWEIVPSCQRAFTKYLLGQPWSSQWVLLVKFSDLIELRGDGIVIEVGADQFLFKAVIGKSVFESESTTALSTSTETQTPLNIQAQWLQPAPCSTRTAVGWRGAHGHYVWALPSHELNHAGKQDVGMPVESATTVPGSKYTSSIFRCTRTSHGGRVPFTTWGTLL